jgi:tape measure domain-containing protein
MADDILLGFVADTKAALEQVLAFVRDSTRGLIQLGDTRPDIIINIANAAESLRTLQADIEAVRRGERDLSGQPLTINTEQAAERLDAVLGMLRGLNEEFLRLPDVAATASAGVAGAADRIAEAERAAMEGVAGLRSELAATAREATAAGEVEAESQAPLIEAARAARTALSELYRSVANGARSVVEEFSAADRAIGVFEERLRAASTAGTAIGASLPAELTRLQSGLLAVATDAEKAGVAIRGVAVAEREAGAAGAAAGAESGGLGLLSRAFTRIAFSIELMLAYMAVRKIRDFTEEMATAAEQGQKLAIAIGAASGSAQAGAEAEAFLRAEALRLGLNVNALSAEFVRLTTVSRQSNVPLADTHELFSRTAEVGRSLRLSTEQINEVLKTFSTVIDRGSVNAMEMRRRLAELPGVMGALRGATQLTEAELAQMAKGGQLAASVLLPMITRLAEEVGGTYRSSLESANAESERLKATLQEDAAAIGAEFLPALAQATADLRIFVESNRDAVDSIGRILSASISVLDDLGRAASRWERYEALVIERLKVIHGLSGDVANAERLLAEASLSAADRARQHEEQLRAEATALAGVLPLLEQQIEAVTKSGKVTREQAVEIVKAYDSAALKTREFNEEDRKAAQERLDRMRESVDGLRRYTIDFTALLGQQIEAVRRYARDFEEELHRTGTVSKEAADKIVKDVQAQVKAIEQLPVAERAAFAEREAALKSLLLEFQSFTTAYEKLGDRQVKAAQHVTEEEAKQEHAREKNLEESLRRIASLIEKPIGKAETGDLAGAQKSLAQQQAELGALKAKPANTADDLNKMQELQLSIDHQTEAVKKLKQAQADQGSAALESASAQVIAQGKVHQAIANLITEDDKFAASFNRLGSDGQAAIQRILTGLDQADKAGTVTGDDVTTAVRRMADVFVQGGVAAADFATRLRADIDPTRTLAQMFDSIKGSGTAGAQALSQVGAAAGQAGASAGAAAAGVRALTAAETEQKQIADVVAFAQRTAGRASLDLAGYGPAVVAAFQAEAAAQRAATQATDAGKAGSIEASNAKGVLIAKSHEAGEAWKEETNNLRENAEALRVATDANVHAQGVGEQGTVQLDKEVVVLSDGSLKWRYRTTQVKDATVATKDATDKGTQLVTGLKNEGTAVEQLNEKLPQLVSAHQQAGAAAEKSAGSEQRGASAMGQMAGAATAAAPAVAGLAGSLEKIAQANPGAALEAAASASKDLLATAGPLSAELGKEESYVDRLDAILRRLAGAYGVVTAARDADRASMAAWLTEAQLVQAECIALTQCLESQAAA